MRGTWAMNSVSSRRHGKMSSHHHHPMRCGRQRTKRASAPPAAPCRRHPCHFRRMIEWHYTNKRICTYILMWTLVYTRELYAPSGDNIELFSSGACAKMCVSPCEMRNRAGTEQTNAGSGIFRNIIRFDVSFLVCLLRTQQQHPACVMTKQKQIKCQCCRENLRNDKTTRILLFLIIIMLLSFIRRMYVLLFRV